MGEHDPSLTKRIVLWACAGVACDVSAVEVVDLAVDVDVSVAGAMSLVEVVDVAGVCVLSRL